MQTTGSWWKKKTDFLYKYATAFGNPAYAETVNAQNYFFSSCMVPNTKKRNKNCSCIISNLS